MRAQLKRNRLLLGLLLAVAFLGVRWAGTTASDEWQTALDTRLSDAGAGTNAAMLAVESDHLRALRGFTYTAGFADALAARDIVTIERLLGPVDANLGVPMVDVLDARGVVIFAFRADDALAPVYRERNDLGIVRRALRGEPDTYGERFSTLVVSDEGAMVASAGPVRSATGVAGALLVMTPLDEVLAASAERHGGLLTVYSGDGGVPLATTAPVMPRALPSRLARVLPADRLPVTSSYALPEGTAREQLGALVIRHEAVAWLGVASPNHAGTVGGRVSVAVALAVVAACGLTAALTIRWRRAGPEPVPAIVGTEQLAPPKELPRPVDDELVARTMAASQHRSSS